jgi:hypothetical protein
MLDVKEIVRKFEARNQKPEIRTKSKIRRRKGHEWHEWTRIRKDRFYLLRMPGLFGFRALDFLRISGFGLRFSRRRGLDDLHLAANPAFAVDHLPALFGLHSGSETDFAGALNIAGFVRIMHDRVT